MAREEINLILGESRREVVYDADKKKNVLVNLLNSLVGGVQYG